jgi:pimeloyl-ACP methyl ester carboxylesterase
MFEQPVANNPAVRRGALLIALVVALAVQGGTAVAADASPRDIVDVPVSFQVQNTNTSRDPCPSDGKSYVVRGHLTGPRAAVLGPGPRAVTLYYEGFDSGEWIWRFRLVPGYDYATEMAKLGQTSVTVDQIGYGASGHPQGNDTCVGAQADIAHQIIGQLRSGTYTAQGTSPAKFKSVVLGAHDVGAAAAEVEAYSYDDINGLMVFTYQDQGFTPFVLGIAANAGARCAAGGEPAYPGGPGGYVYYPQVSDWPTLMPNSEPAVIAGAIASRLRNPCGLIPTTATTATLNFAGATTGTMGLGEIHVPVLLVLGALDPVFTHDGFEQQARYYTGSRDVTAALMPGTGHFETLDGNAPRFRKLVADWLGTRGF